MQTRPSFLSTRSKSACGDRTGTLQSLRKRACKSASLLSVSSIGGQGEGRKHNPDASMVVDYYYHLYHPEIADNQTAMGGRSYSFGSIAKQPKDKKRCFVISPIGAEGSEIRQHADNVFSFIIMPAMHSRAIDCVRSDMINDLGQITDQMYEAIFGWDLCITVLTYLNPNVFYELALRQCVGLPVICLVEKNVCLPFDVADLRVIEYTLKPSLLFKGLYSEQLVDAVDYLIDQKWKTKYSFAKFRPSICSAPCYYSDVQDFLHDGANDYEMSPAWTDLVKQANHLDMMGITLKHWKRFEDEVKAAAARCCHVRLLILDKDNDSLASFASCQGKQLEAFRLMLDHMYSFFGTMAGTSNYITLRKVTKGSMNFGCALTDKELVYQPWFYDFSKVDETPLFHTDAKSPLYRVVSDDFNLLWKLNEASDSSMVVDLEDSLTN